LQQFTTHSFSSLQKGGFQFFMGRGAGNGYSEAGIASIAAGLSFSSTPASIAV
jgi:hypothetical protein